MVGRRLLMAVGVFLLLSSPWLSIIPRWSPAIQGRVVDGTTGEPVEGAFVRATYFGEIPIRTPGETNTRELDSRWDLTDAEGRFLIEGAWRERFHFPFVTWSVSPKLFVIHPMHGFFSFWLHGDPNLDNLELKVVGTRESVRDVSDPGNFHFLCIDWLDKACAPACEVAYGSSDPCAPPERLVSRKKGRNQEARR